MLYLLELTTQYYDYESGWEVHKTVGVFDSKKEAEDYIRCSYERDLNMARIHRRVTADYHEFLYGYRKKDNEIAWSIKNEILTKDRIYEIKPIEVNQVIAN